jgi:hypothetical protein
MYGGSGSDSERECDDDDDEDELPVVPLQLSTKKQGKAQIRMTAIRALGVEVYLALEKILKGEMDLQVHEMGEHARKAYKLSKRYRANLAIHRKYTPLAPRL